MLKLHFEKVASVSYAIKRNKITDLSYKNINIETGAYPQISTEWPGKVVEMHNL